MSCKWNNGLMTTAPSAAHRQQVANPLHSKPPTLRIIFWSLICISRQVKSGGHAVNPSFSSTPGVLIVTSQFNGTVYDADAQTATIGTGQTWAEVYPVLQPYNVSVLGGRMSPIGVGGYVMGGGKSRPRCPICVGLINVG